MPMAVSNTAPNKTRYALPDTLRGLTLLSMIAEKVRRGRDLCETSSYGHAGSSADWENWERQLKELAKGLRTVGEQREDIGSEPSARKDVWDDAEYLLEQGMDSARSSYELEYKLHGFINASLRLLNKDAFVLGLDDVDTRPGIGWHVLEVLLALRSEAHVTALVAPAMVGQFKGGLPRIIKNREDLDWLCTAVDTPYNGITLCCGSIAEEPGNDIYDILAEFTRRGRIHFVHMRNIKYISPDEPGNKDFYEAPHPSPCGSLDMYKMMRALHDNGFTGYMRPDHGRMIWGETGRPGYGLYDRALGIAYINGMWEAIEKGA